VRMPSVKVPLVIGTPPISFSSFALVMVPVASVVFTLDSVVFGEEYYAWQKGDTMREELEIGEVSGTDLSRHVNATDLSLWVFVSLISNICWQFGLCRPSFGIHAAFCHFSSQDSHFHNRANWQNLGSWLDCGGSWLWYSRDVLTDPLGSRLYVTIMVSGLSPVHSLRTGIVSVLGPQHCLHASDIRRNAYTGQRSASMVLQTFHVGFHHCSANLPQTMRFLTSLLSKPLFFPLPPYLSKSPPYMRTLSISRLRFQHGPFPQPPCPKSVSKPTTIAAASSKTRSKIPTSIQLFAPFRQLFSALAVLSWLNPMITVATAIVVAFGMGTCMWLRNEGQQVGAQRLRLRLRLRPHLVGVFFQLINPPCSIRVLHPTIAFHLTPIIRPIKPLRTTIFVQWPTLHHRPLPSGPELQSAPESPPPHPHCGRPCPP